MPNNPMAQRSNALTDRVVATHDELSHVCYRYLHQQCKLLCSCNDKKTTTLVIHAHWPLPTMTCMGTLMPSGWSIVHFHSVLRWAIIYVHVWCSARVLGSCRCRGSLQGTGYPLIKQYMRVLIDTGPLSSMALHSRSK